MALLHRDFKAGDVNFPQGALVHDGVRCHPPQLLGVGGEVFGAGGHAIFLDAPDVSRRHFTRQVGVLGEILKVAPAKGAALDVQPRPQQDTHVLGRGLNSQIPANFFT